MSDKLRLDAEKIYTGAIKASLPDAAVASALRGFSLPRGKLIVVSIGKAAYRMAMCAEKIIRDRHGKIDSGIVITKYEHSEGEISGFEIYEAGHPVPDENGIFATERVLEITKNLTQDDLVLFLVSGGGSALFESPRCSLEELTHLTKKLLSSGADISEMNAVRKHISKVKGGRFAEHVYPAKVFSVVLSDVIGNRLDTIASGPSAPDGSTVSEVFQIIEKYGIEISDTVREALSVETPKEISNAEHVVSGSVSELCKAAAKIAGELGYSARIITDNECGFAKDVGRRLSELAVANCDTERPLALILGGETVVKLVGVGLGGRNQETALAAAKNISGLKNVAIFSVGSDGTDGPTDAAGGYVDGESYEKMTRVGINPEKELENNNSYNALGAIDGLIFTGPTGTNVNDVAVVLIDR